MRKPERITILECPVDRLTVPDTLAWIADAVAHRHPAMIAVVNANKLHQMAGNAELRAIVTSADLIVPEWAMVWAARRLKLPPLHHSGGLLIAQAFLPFAEEHGLRPFFLGAKPEVVAALVARVRRDYPRVPIAGFHHGYLTDPSTEAGAIEKIKAAAPDILFVAMGSPAQERWIMAHKAALGVPVSIGIGGSFDVLSGMKPDTPSWARGRGLEWLYRLALDPRAYGRRYLVTNSWFVTKVLIARVTGRRS